jgi:hypothetical protein
MTGSRFSYRTIGLAVALVASMAIGMSQSLAAACDCDDEGQCTSGSCCFSNGFCMPADKLCMVEWMGSYFECRDDLASCNYTGPPCGS